IWPALLVCGGSFAGVQFLVSNYHGPWLVDVAGGLVSLVALALFVKVWQPRTIWKFADEPGRLEMPDERSISTPAQPAETFAAPESLPPMPDPTRPEERITAPESLPPMPQPTQVKYSLRQVVSAWVPWVLL